MKRLTFKYIGDEHHFIDNTSSEIYGIFNKKKECLGEIYFYKEWKKWVFESEEKIVFTWDCLKEIGDFMKGLS